jgi:hypothetical protein
MEIAALGNVDIFVRFRLGVDPYFHLPMSDTLVGWWKVWFFLRNNPSMPLPMFMGSRLIPQPKWRYGVAQMDLCKLQPLHDVGFVDVSRAKLSRSSLLHGVGRFRDQHSDPVGSCSWG